MKKLGIIFIVLLGFIALPSKCFANELVEDYFDIATNYSNMANYSKALEYVNYVLMLNPKNDKAIKFKNKLLPQESNDDLTQTAIILSKQKDIDNLVILDIPSTKKTKIENSSDYYNKQGKKFYLNKEYDSAVQCFYQAVSIDPKNYLAYNNLGMTYWMKNNLEYAEKYFQKAISISKTYPQPYINLALLYKQVGNMNKYHEYLQKALKVNPNNYWSYYLLGDYYTSIDNHPEAIKYYLQAIDINPNFAQPHLSLALAYFKTDKYQQSIDSLNSYIGLTQKSDFAYSMLAKNYQLLGDNQKAIENIKKAISINPSNMYRFELAKIQFNAEDYSHALINFQILLPEYDYAEIYNYIGLCNYMLKSYDNAIAYFNMAIVSDGHRPIYFYNLAMCYKETNNKAKYVQYINAALQINPVTYQDYIDLSCIYYNTSKTSIALKTLEMGINTYPDCKPLYMAMLNIYGRMGETSAYNKTKEIIESRFNSNEQTKKKNILFK